MKDRDTEADRRRMSDLGYNADRPATVEKYQEQQQKLEDGRINQREFQHAMYMHEFDQEEGNRRGAVGREDARAADRSQQGDTALTAAAVAIATSQRDAASHEPAAGREVDAGEAQTPQEKRQALLAEIDKGAERPAQDRESAQRSLDEHIERGGDHADTRQDFRDTAHEVTGTTTPKRSDIER